VADQVIFDKSRPGRRGFIFDSETVPGVSGAEGIDPRDLRKEAPRLPQISELDLVRHYTNLSRKNFGVDVGFYPLGSCTMKYNPKVNEKTAGLAGFTNLHPLQGEGDAQGTLELMQSLKEGLCEVTGMKEGTLSPFAGAQGEFTGMKLFKAYFRDRGETGRTRILVPDSSHGTNPASAHIAGFEVVELPSNREGLIDPAEVARHCDERLAGIMMTNPNTLGLFESEILAIAGMVHKAGGLLYYDGANLNAIMGKAKPGNMGFDCVHLNLHKTFSTPHGGGGPGAGPVLVGEKLIPYLPEPVTERKDGKVGFAPPRPGSIGRVSGFYGNVGVLVRAYTYLLTNGGDGLTAVSEMAVLNAAYLKKQLKHLIEIPYGRKCMHEFVLSAQTLKEETGISALDIAKGLLERGIHPPTIYFPLNVKEALMVEPTETESRETLDTLVEALKEIVALARENPEELKASPRNTWVGRVDEVLAARKPRVNHFSE
jgi:glycine dehydrogenase subunit 2